MAKPERGYRFGVQIERGAASEAQSTFRRARTMLPPMESISDIANLFVGAGGMLAAGFMWIGQPRTKQIDQDRRLKALEDKLDGHSETAQLVTRLDERLLNISEELKRQPQVIALCVGEAIKAALAYRIRTAPAAAAGV